jgi:acyl dehydratase
VGDVLVSSSLEKAASGSLQINEEDSFATIDDEMIERERKRVGTVLRRPSPFIELASRDAIRHWAEGIGDRNPLWLDDSYAATTKWGGMLAPPTIAMALTSCVASGFRALHAWHLGTSMEWSRPIRRDETFDAVDILESISQVQSSYSGPNTWDQVIKSEITERSTGEVACAHRLNIRRFERNAGRESRKEQRERATYTPDELMVYAEEALAERPRGKETLRVADVNVGDQLGSIVRGPLTSSDCLAFMRGWGGAYILSHADMWEFVKRHKGAFPLDESGVPDTPERTHWSDAFARKVGAPTAFDYGPQRIAWCGTLVTNWMGDDAFLRRLDVALRAPNYHGDVVRLTGQVTQVDIATRTVNIDLAGHNQLGSLIVDGHAVVELEYPAGGGETPA